MSLENLSQKDIDKFMDRKGCPDESDHRVPGLGRKPKTSLELAEREGEKTLTIVFRNKAMHGIFKKMLGAKAMSSKYIDATELYETIRQKW